jgi:hypothetical protein
MSQPTPQWSKPDAGIRNSTWIGYVPDRMNLPDRPELSDLPEFVAFGAVDERAGRRQVATAFYVPDWSALNIDDEKIGLTYRNLWGGKAEISIVYDRKRRIWAGIKLVHGSEVGRSMGGSWQGFFKHFAMLGLSYGEPCYFHDVPA